MSYEFKGYSAYAMSHFTHKSVNHSKFYVDPVTKCDTQVIERKRVDTKSWWKRSRGSRTYLQEHLDEAAWRMLRSSHRRNGALFHAFLEDMRLSSTTLEKMIEY